MDIIITIGLLILGIILIVKGGDIFVDAATWMAEVSGIPKFIIGATVVSVATTLPELFVSVIAASQGKVDMSIGNAVGSVTANIGLIMALALIFLPMGIKRKDYAIKVSLMMGAALLLVVFGSGGSFGIFPSVLFLCIFAVNVAENIISAKRAMGEPDPKDTSELDDSLNTTRKTIAVNVAKFIIGAAAIVWGADLLVDNGSELAAIMGVPERVISVTIIAIGTSLPELVTTVTAIIKKQGTLSVGNIIGANIIDLTLIMPICAIVSGGALPVTAQVGSVDLPACLIVGAIAVIPTMITKKFSRWQGFVLLAVYIAYVIITTVVVQ